MENSIIHRLKDQAIEKAIAGHFQEAIDLNFEILTLAPEDTDVLMQLAHAYWQIGDIVHATKYYRKTLSVDPNNILAIKRLDLLKPLSIKSQKSSNRKKGRIIPVSEFIEEPGKTKTVRLSNLGKPEHISLLNIGEEIDLNIRKHKIEARDESDNFIGYLPDDISKRLVQFILGECTYEAFIFSIDKNEVKIFIREIEKKRKFRHVSSFIFENSMIMHPDSLSDDDKAEGVTEEEDEELDLTEEALLEPTLPSDKKKKLKEDEEEEEKNDDDHDDDDDYEK
ncbi:MAG: hypothetical protein AAB893_04695 [Patescibacteria group bacterium]